MAMLVSRLLLLIGLFLLGDTIEDNAAEILSLKAEIKRLKTQIADNTKEMEILLQENQELVNNMNPYQESAETHKTKLQAADEVSKKQMDALRKETSLQQQLQE